MKQIAFIDLFAGIGGIRLPFDELGYKCVFSSEWDAAAAKTYEENWLFMNMCGWLRHPFFVDFRLNQTKNGLFSKI